MPEGQEPENFSPYVSFTNAEWSKLRDTTPLPLTEVELAGLRGLNDHLSLQEVAEIYLRSKLLVKRSCPYSWTDPIRRMRRLGNHAVGSLH